MNLSEKKWPNETSLILIKRYTKGQYTKYILIPSISSILEWPNGWLVGWLSLDGLTSLSLGVTVLLLEGKDS
jgi:hypothetical protein